MQHNQPRKFNHDQHARTKDETDFWGQIRRTVNGKPVDETQIAMIIDRIIEKLTLRKSDVLLDLACGNGALSNRFFNRINAYQGVDFSERLIEVANKYFASPPDYTFLCSGASEYVDSGTKKERFTKALCYGSFSYFHPEHAENVLRKLQKDFKNITHIFIGNLPDKKLAEEFYGKNKVNPQELPDNESPIGTWRSRDEFIEMAKRHGWKAEISVMPDRYYASYYRYDALLTR
jgi:cyclopropane fatty-acyl-phospholipid synthase-like methyltransferase